MMDRARQTCHPECVAAPVDGTTARLVGRGTAMSPYRHHGEDERWHLLLTPGIKLVRGHK